MAVDKYTVFKAKDWSAFCDGMGEDGVHWHGEAGITISELADRVLEDAVVLRFKDRFTATALQAYCDAVSNSIEVMEECGMLVPSDLHDLRDTFFEFAEAARKQPVRRIPD